MGGLPELKGWKGTSSKVCEFVAEQSERCLQAYKVNPSLIKEHAAIERATRQGGYGRRQLFELVQNGADALQGHAGGRIQVLLTPHALYCANQGEPIDEDGVEAILSSHLNVKKANEIGRFGIGFKSVLAVSQTPEFFSKSGSFRFDATSAKERIRRIKPDAKDIPVLRTAEPVDPAEAAAADIELGLMMEWATTIIRLPRSGHAADWLAEDIKSFPPEFLLFSPQVAVLDLEARPGKSRELRVERDRDGLRLIADGRDESWWTTPPFRFRPSPAVVQDGGVLAERDNLPLVWAVERQGRVGRGRFWSFFPTETITTVSGILNAPWKTNEDRQNLLPGPFNEEFIREAARLVVDHLHQLAVRSDPARHIDLLPSRDSYNFADKLLGEEVFKLAKARAIVPDQDGDPRVPREVRVHPAGTSQKALALWASYPGRPKDWCHPDVETTNRRPRIEQLVPSANIATADEWLEALAEDLSAEASATAVRVAAVMIADGAKPQMRRDILSAEIVLTDQGKLVTPAVVLIAADGRPRSASGAYVHPDLVADEETLAALHELGVKESSSIADLKAFLATFPWGTSDRDWDAFWSLCRRVSPTEMLDAVKAAGHGATDVRMKTLAGTFVSIRSALLPGKIVDGESRTNAAATIDVEYHANTIDHLTRLGATAGPEVAHGSVEEEWFDAYLTEYRERYREKLRTEKGGSIPQAGLLTFEEAISGRGAFTGPLEVLDELDDVARARFTLEAIRVGAGSPQWTMVHETNPGRYPKLKVRAPVLWRLRSSGRVSTSKGVMRIPDAVGPSLAAVDALLPVAECSIEAAAYLRIPNDPMEVPQARWRQALADAHQSADDTALGALLSYAVAAGIRPASIRCRAGDGFGSFLPSEVVVVSDPEDLERVRRHKIPVVLAPSQQAADSLVTDLGMHRMADSVRIVVEGSLVRDPAPLIDEFPPLRWYLPPERRGLLLARCDELQEAIVTPAGTTYEDREYVLDDDRAWWLDRLGDLDLLHRLRSDLGLAITDEDCDKLANRRASEEREAKVEGLRSEPDVYVRLASAVGDEAIRARLPQRLLMMAEEKHGGLDSAQLGRLAHAIYGPDVLRQFSDELASAGLEPPTVWSGTEKARAFVRDLGFPDQFAGQEHSRLDPLVEVLGPPDLPPLHDYQRRAADRTRALIADRSGRALLSLPTGAGKTRVIVEALVELLRDAVLLSPVVWIAETGELCEQAVQAWAYVWRAIGSKDRLIVSRLWSSNEAAPTERGSQVVVATSAKLRECLDDPSYDWLRTPSAVVIDEAHGAITHEYTQLLAWFGITGERPGPPLIGMTATPYRGKSEDETARLVRRFYGNRLDDAGPDVDQYAELQAMGVLAKVRHAELPGASITLTQKELDLLRRTSLMPTSAGARVGTDPRRNEILLESIRALPDDWTVLLFAASVEHAEIMAALLTLEGITAAAVSSNTPAPARRYFVEEFRAGKIRVLANYAVLTEGFDAPAVRAVYVARPTYSPNLYQQMIGRGLRGPLNGGKDECLIVNVRDNIAQYGEALAFTQFEYLWRNGVEAETGAG